jgi:hypothetical protein
MMDKLHFGFIRPMTIGIELDKREIGSTYFTDQLILIFTVWKCKVFGFIMDLKIQISTVGNGNYKMQRVIFTMEM